MKLSSSSRQTLVPPLPPALPADWELAQPATGCSLALSIRPTTRPGLLQPLWQHLGDRQPADCGRNSYQIPIASNVMNLSVSQVTINGTHRQVGPRRSRSFSTRTRAWIAFTSASTTPSATVGSCTATTGNGCIVAYNVTDDNSGACRLNEFPFPNTTGNNGCWGTSAFIIDNGTSSTDTSNVYFEYFGGDSPSTVPSPVHNRSTWHYGSVFGIARRNFLLRGKHPNS